MNALQQLVQDWLDAEPGRTVPVLAQHAGLHRNTLYTVLRDGAGVPRKATMEKLARGLGVPVQRVRDAAFESAGFRVEEVEGLSPEMRGWVALLGELSPERRKDLSDLANIYLRQMKNAP